MKVISFLRTANNYQKHIDKENKNKMNIDLNNNEESYENANYPYQLRDTTSWRGQETDYYRSSAQYAYYPSSMAPLAPSAPAYYCPTTSSVAISHPTVGYDTSYWHDYMNYAASYSYCSPTISQPNIVPTPVVRSESVTSSPESTTSQTNSSPPTTPNNHGEQLMQIVTLVNKDVNCQVCGDKSVGFHYGVFSCKACKIFFARAHNRRREIKRCKENQNCEISATKKSNCGDCRFRKCQMQGMSKTRSRFGRHASGMCTSRERIEALKSSLQAAIRSCHSRHPTPNADNIRDLFSMCLGIVEPNCELARYRFLISNVPVLTNLADCFATFFCKQIDPITSDTSSNESSTSTSELSMIANQLVLVDFEDLDSKWEAITPLKCYCFIMLAAKALIRGVDATESTMLEIKLRQLIKDELNVCGKGQHLLKLIGCIVRMADAINSL